MIYLQWVWPPQPKFRSMQIWLYTFCLPPPFPIPYWDLDNFGRFGSIHYFILTRMHSSRMRTVRNSSRLPGGCTCRGVGRYPPPSRYTPPWTEWLTDRCKNITFTTSFRTVKIVKLLLTNLHIHSKKVVQIQTKSDAVGHNVDKHSCL